MKNTIAILAFEQVLATMIFGILPVTEDHDELVEYYISATAEQARRIFEEDGNYSLEYLADACKELALFFGRYA